MNYNFVPEWLKDLDYTIYDRSDNYEYLKGFRPLKIVYTKNWGNVDYDKLSWIISNYAKLPKVFLLTKSNIFKFITPEEFDKVKDNQTFTPLLTANHNTYSDPLGIVCYYKDGIYWERNDSWYVPAYKSKFLTYNDWARYMGLPTPDYLPFAPGGNYILTPKEIHKYPKEFYIKMRETLNHCMLPAEAHFVERSYYTIWSGGSSESVPDNPAVEFSP